MKKILALVLAFAMVFSTITVAFAEEEVVVAEVSAEAKALGTIGMLEGDGDGVTAEYTGKELNRLTAAIMILKLKGLYEDALKYDGVNNFADAEGVKWPEGKNILAYLKDNPTVGFGGNEKGEFNPTGTLNEQMLYKVLLENLGYKQVAADVADGDFAWEETLEFAEKIGLKPAKAEKFTVDGLSKAVVGALKTNMKDGKAWIDVLVDAKKVDKDKAVVAGLMEEAPAVTAALKSAKALGNTVVEVEFDGEVSASYAENLDIYAIEGLEIKSAMLDGTKKVLLETEAQKAGTKYTLVVGEAKYNFGGVAKVTGAPSLEKVEGPDTDRVKLTFDKVLDTVSAKDVANYTISGVTIVSAKLDAARKVVTLTTEGLTAKKSHTIKVMGVKSVDGTALKSATRTFYSKSDKELPRLKAVKADTFKRIIVTFSEEVTKESAEDITNYTIKAGSTELEIEKIEQDEDDEAVVEITTAAQKAGTRYELSVNNIVDQSVLGNTMVKPSKMTFSGVREDKEAPAFTKFEYAARNKVVVTFSDKSRLDKESALNTFNYTISNDISVENAEILPGADEKTFMEVLLTVSDLGGKNKYDLTISGVADEYGNEMGEKKLSANYNNTEVVKSAVVKEVVATKENEVKIYFTKYLDVTTAKDVASYSINGDIGTPAKATYKASEKSVTLTTGSDLVAGKSYTLTIDGLMDIAGNVLKFKPTFVGLTLANDVDAPEIEYIEAVNNEVVRVTFTEKINNPTSATITILGAKDGHTATLKGKVTYDSGKTVEFSDASYTYPTQKVGLRDQEYAITVATSIKDKAGNEYKPDANNDVFWGNTDKPTKVELLSWEQVNGKEFKLVFSEKVDKAASFAGLTPRIDDDDDTIGYLKSTTVMKLDREYKSDIEDSFKNYHGVPVENYDTDAKKTTFTVTMEDTEKPYIENVVALDRETIEITYNEDIETAGNYGVTYTDDKGNVRTISVTVGAPDENVVELAVTGAKLESKYTYTLKVKTGAKDYSSNQENKDDEFVFEGSDIQPIGNYVTGVNFINGKEVEVKTKIALVASKPISLKEDKATTFQVAYTPGNTVAGTTQTFTLAANKGVFKAGRTYKVTVDTLSYEFEGIVEDGISVVSDVYDGNGTTTIKLVYDGMEVGDTIEVRNGTVASATITPQNVTDGYFTVTVSGVEGTKVEVIVLRGTVPLYFFEK